MKKEDRENICQCLHCGHVFDFKDANRNGLYTYGVCPECNGTFSIIAFKNLNDEFYADFVSFRYG